MVGIGEAVTAVAALLLYLASSWAPVASTVAVRRTLGVAGLVLFPCGVAMLIAGRDLRLALFIAVTIAMLVWSLAPLLFGWSLRSRKTRP